MADEEEVPQNNTAEEQTYLTKGEPEQEPNSHVIINGNHKSNEAEQVDTSNEKSETITNERVPTLRAIAASVNNDANPNNSRQVENESNDALVDSTNDEANETVENDIDVIVDKEIVTKDEQQTVAAENEMPVIENPSSAENEQLVNELLVTLRKIAESKIVEFRELSSTSISVEGDTARCLLERTFKKAVGGPFDTETCFVVQDTVDILTIMELLNCCDWNHQLITLVYLHAMLKISVQNLQAATQVGLITRLLHHMVIEKDDVLADKLIEIVGTLAMYSITVKELKAFLAALKQTEDNKWPKHAIKLIEILKKMPEKHGPDVYFNFSGKPGSLIALPPLFRWPHQPGFTFSTWLQLDAGHLANVEKAGRPHLYCFANSKGLGYSAHFSGPMLVLEVHGKSGKLQTVLVKFEFRPRIWYHIAVTHTYNRFKSSEIKCFVYGQMVTSAELTLPNYKESMDKCFVGGSYIADQKFILKGQMSAVYVFAEPLLPNVIAAIYRLGPGYKGQFKFVSELDIMLYETDRKVLFDGKLASSVLLTYNPKAIDKRQCLESSSTENPNCFTNVSHALMLEGVQSVVTHSLQAALHSLGGIQMLYPLFTQLDSLLFDAEKLDPKVCSLLLGLIYDLLRGSAVFQQQFLQSKGFMVIGHLLETCSPIHLTEDTVDILLGLARYFMSNPCPAGLLGSLLDHVLLNPMLWTKTPLQLQSNLLSLFATGYVGGLDYAGYIRKEVGVPRLIVMLTKYYSLRCTPDGSLITHEEMISLRAFVLLLLKQMIIKDDGILEEELRSILMYFTIEEEERNYPDVLNLLLSTMCEMPLSIIPCFDLIEGFQIIFNLLVSHDETVRVLCVKILACYAQHLTVQRKIELVDKYGFVSMIGVKLSIFPLTLITYNALFELLTAKVSKHVLTERRSVLDTPHLLYHPTVLPVIVKLLVAPHETTGTQPLQSPLPKKDRGNENVALTQIFLSDIIMLLSQSNDNKRLLLQLMCWQEWLFSMLYFEPSTKDQLKVADSIYTIVRMLLHYGLQSEKDGWRVWVDTLSILHSESSEYWPSDPTSPRGSVSSPQTEAQSSNDANKSPDSTNVNQFDPDRLTPNAAAPPQDDNESTTEQDHRRQFFAAIIKSNSEGKRTLEEPKLRRSQSASEILNGHNDVNDDKTEADDRVMTNNDDQTINTRPRSASPTIALVETSTELKSAKSVDLVVHQLDNTSINDQVVDSDNVTASEEPVSPRTKIRPFIDVPEFKWSVAHQRLLTDLLFAIEADLQVWKTHNRKSVSDFVNMKENLIYVLNLCHLVSVLSDSLVFCCGGLLPLLSSATSRNFESDVLEPCGGMTLDAAFAFLNRLMNLIDVVTLASSISFSTVESHRDILPGGVLRQCLRLVFCSAARNRVVCRQRERPTRRSSISSNHSRLNRRSVQDTQEAIDTLIASTKPPTEEDFIEMIPGHMTTITNEERLLQDIDINRLRFLVYREVEDSRQSQYAALVVIYFVAVVMVSRYRDILHSDDDEVGPVPPRSQSIDERTATAPSDSDPTNRARSSSAHARVQTSTSNNDMSLESRIHAAFATSGAALKEILFDFAPYLSRVLVGSHGQDLIADGLGSLKLEDSTVELVMLLCSQEWQNSLQRHAGAAFMDLVNEGRLISHATRERIVVTACEARDILQEKESLDQFRHAQFQTKCTKTVISYFESYRMYDRLLRARGKRNKKNSQRMLDKLFGIMTSDFGAWPSPHHPSNSNMKFFKQDLWQDFAFRRMHMVKNPLGTTHSEAILQPTDEESGDGRKGVVAAKYFFYKPTSSQQVNESSQEDDGWNDAPEALVDERQSRETEEIDLTFSSNCHVIAPGLYLPGTFVLTSSAMYFTVDEDDEAIKKVDTNVLSYFDCVNVKGLFAEMTRVCTRKNLFQNVALEIFMEDRRSYLFAFDSHDTVRKIISILPAVGIGAFYGLPQTRTISLLSPKQLFSKSDMTERWQRREISNFDYISFLNFIAGRSQNDINQYPVFPWVVADYESEVLDLTKDTTFRDLSKPVGALNPFRLGQFIERFNTWDREEGIPPFHYGTHYSTAGFVLNWLVRVEPFSSLFLGLQGGKFDHPSRTFSSINASWENCQRDTSDVKELIPELFYLPEMLINNNKFEFGKDDDGRLIDNVDLPKWANNAQDFIRLHRQALESDYVSNNIHKWVDLIFGPKQKGIAAEHAANVFYYLTYEGNVDLNTIQDAVTKEAVEQQIKSFGQTPSQLITTPHPPRSMSSLKTQDAKEQHKNIFLTFKVTPGCPIVHVSANIDRKSVPAIVTVSNDQVFSVNRWMNFGGAITSYHSLQQVQIEQDPILDSQGAFPRRQLGELLDETIQLSTRCFSVTTDNRCILACGYWDNSFKSFSTDTGRLTQCIYGHWDVVTCIALDDDMVAGNSAVIVSGSRDATVQLWRWDYRQRKVTGNTKDGATPVAVCSGHESAVVCVAVNLGPGIVASASQGGACLLHSTKGELLRILVAPPSCLSPKIMSISNEGHILANFSEGCGQLALFSINGRLLRYAVLEKQINDIVFSADGCFFVAAAHDQCFYIWRTHDLMLQTAFPPCDDDIESVTLTRDQKCLVAGLGNGEVIAIAMDFSLWS